MSAPFPSVRAAALAVLNSDAPQSWKSGQFLGGICYMDGPLSERQAKWLADILRKARLPPLADGGGQ
jgi:hypothetical protein